MTITHNPSKVLCSFISNTPYIFIKSTYNDKEEHLQVRDLFTTTLFPENSQTTYESQIQQITHIDEDLMLSSILHLIPNISETFSAILFCDSSRIKKINVKGNELTTINENASIICAYKSFYSHTSDHHVLHSLL